MVVNQLESTPLSAGALDSKVENIIEPGIMGAMQIDSAICLGQVLTCRFLCGIVLDIQLCSLLLY